MKALSRKSVNALARFDSIIKQTLENCKDYCNKCWSKELDPLIQGYARGIGMTQKDIDSVEVKEK